MDAAANMPNTHMALPATTATENGSDSATSDAITHPPKPNDLTTGATAKTDTAVTTIAVVHRPVVIYSSCFPSPRAKMLAT